MIRVRHIILFSMVLLAVFYLTMACKHQTNNSKSTFEVTDMLGRKVQVPTKVERVVGLRAGALRLLVYMDASSMIAGVEEGEKQFNRPYINAHRQLLLLPSIGQTMGGDAEMILSAKPDVIFITYTTVGDANALQQKTGVPVVAIDATEMATAVDTLYASLHLMGKVLNRAGRADSLVAYIKGSIEELNRRTKDIHEKIKPSVYVGGLSYSGAHGLCSTHAHFPPFVFVNAKNVASSISSKNVSHVKGTFIDTEQVLVWNPDVIFIDQAGLELVEIELKTGWYIDLDAFKNKHIHQLLPYNNYATNYEMVLMNAWMVGKTIYPEHFADIDIDEKYDEISQWFLKCDFHQLFKTIENNN